MRALVLGGAGMLGHRLWRELDRHVDAFATVRSSADDYASLDWFDPRRIIGAVDVLSDADLDRAMSAARPDVVINAVGIVKQRRDAESATTTIAVNALLPHRLADQCAAAGARLIHISTDCVFAGTKGAYTEADVPDAHDLYGRSKLLGEVDRAGCLTVRTSMVGREIRTSRGLFEWFFSHRGEIVPGFTRARFSGLTTAELSRVIADIVQRQPELRGVWHVAGDPINKFDLLTIVNDAFRLGSTLRADESFVCDRTLDASRFMNATGYRPPSWAAMVAELAADPTPYDAWALQWTSTAH
ncbi:MAG TPA: SDR family oxidoreductase, partial [Gemmatimonadaceae bacterium]|nr:SDR family oxidoreductase [Gemmatimonadaceae bacterium]